MFAHQLYTEKNGERFLKSAHRFLENAYRFSAATAVSRTRVAVLLLGVAE